MNGPGLVRVFFLMSCVMDNGQFFFSRMLETANKSRIFCLFLIVFFPQQSISPLPPVFGSVDMHHSQSVLSVCVNIGSQSYPSLVVELWLEQSAQPFVLRYWEARQCPDSL